MQNIDQPLKKKGNYLNRKMKFYVPLAKNGHQEADFSQFVKNFVAKDMPGNGFGK